MFTIITHDENYLYVGFKAYGNQENTRARIRSRDSIYYLNDFVDIGIDTYADGRYTVSFSVNPKGSIGDRKYSSFWPDASYNVEFEGNGHFTDYGYEAELRIPFTWKQKEQTKLTINTKHLNNRSSPINQYILPCNI